MIDLAELQQRVALPSRLTPVVIVGAGSIVVDAHLPAYAGLGVPVVGVFDLDTAQAAVVAERSGAKVFATLAEAVAQEGVVFDLALPPAALPAVLRELPDGATVILQKPMGSTLAEASEILRICQSKSLQAALNFQLRFAPAVLAFKDAVASGVLGEVVDFEAQMRLSTPWHLWAFLADLPRVEVLLHSIHYLDFIRDVLGEPDGVHARTMGHPSSTVSNTRSAIILDYGDRARCNLSINHNHAFGGRYQASEFHIGGTQGAAYLKLGVNLDYPRGEADELWINQGGDWQAVPLCGNWFTAAFEGRFAQVQRFAAGLDKTLEGSVEDAWHTMALVEATYESAALPAHPIKEAPDA